MQIKTTRIEKWDNYKFILIMLVVIGHLMKGHLKDFGLAKSIYWIIYTFHMPAFIMTSGMFAKRSVRKHAYEKSFMFFLLYFMIKLLMFLNRMFMGERISVTWMSASGIEWYALAIGVYYLITIFLQNFDRKQIFFLAVLIGCLAGFDIGIGDKYALARMTTFYPFFLTGFYLDSEVLIQAVQKKRVKFVAAVVLLVTIWIGLRYIEEIYWTIDLFKGNCSYRIFKRAVRGYAVFYRLGQYLISSVLLFAVFALTPSGKYCFSHIGQQTLPIYALHYMAIEQFYQIFHAEELILSIGEPYNVLLLILIGTLLVLLLSLKPFVRFVNWMIIPRRLVPKRRDETE